MATIKLRKWDSAEHLKTDEDIALYLEACLEEGGDDAAFIAKALGTIHGNVTALLNAGILDRADGGGIIFPFDAVKVEFLLQVA